MRFIDMILNCLVMMSVSFFEFFRGVKSISITVQ